VRSIGPGARRAAAGLVALALLGLPVACGDAEASYCDALRSRQEIFAGDGSSDGFLDALPDLEELAEKAPDDLRDEWQTFTGALETLDKTIVAAGVKPRDIVGGRKPATVTDAQWTAITTAADSLSSVDVAQAVDGIDQQAKDVCKLQLGL
jgi:hypothetical protein